MDGLETMRMRGEEEVGFGVRELEGMELSVNNNNGEIIREEAQCSSSSSSSPFYLDKFTLYKTHHNYYIAGRDVREKHWRVLKIGRNNPSELVTQEDPTTYSYETCNNLLCSINEASQSTGGLKNVTECYGIVGFIKLVETYYILLITERREIGRICGHRIYSISEYRIIPLARHTNALTYMYNHSKETRYRKLLQLVDIRENFYFSCSYPLMRRVQQNLSKQVTVPSSDGKMFVWNEYLTQQTRANLKNTLWTVALIHGFFKQVELSTAGKAFILTIIARRSCQFAGTRFEKRGVNEKGQSANDVEIEQIVWPHIHNKEPSHITSVVQMRASIPLRWSQKSSSVLSIKPGIIISEYSDTYNATKLHFQSLRLRYKAPTIILNLVKSTKVNHPEYILHEKFEEAVKIINDGLAEKDRVEFLSLDLDATFKNKNMDEFMELEHFAKDALNKTGIFHSKMPQSVNFNASFDLSYTRINNAGANSLEGNSLGANSNGCDDNTKQQQGVLRSNCLDSLDRTNVAQYIYGMVALIHQLNTLQIIESIESQKVDFKNGLACDVMNIYQAMGDALSQQYGGSAAHHKIFAKHKGQNHVKTKFQECLKSIQRHCSNAFTDGTKQQAIDLFLGQMQPETSEMMTPRRRNADQNLLCEWLTAIYMRNLSGCRRRLLSGFTGFRRLWHEDGADESNHRYLTGPCGSSNQGSRNGYSMEDFAAGS